MVSTLAYPSMIGWDELFEKANKWMQGNQNNYPPYNVVSFSEEQKKEYEYDWDYEIQIAVAGFGTEDLKVSQEGNILTISGDSEDNEYTNLGTFLHRGIGTRKFTKQFTLADNIEVCEENVGMFEGLLVIGLKKVENNSKSRYFHIRG